MTTAPITGTLPPGYAPPVASPGTPAGGSNTVNSQTFLKLLVAQLQYQNPESPTDPTQMLSQTAMFQEVQQLQALQTSMTSMLAAQQASSASSMLGATATATVAATGRSVTGTVTSVDLSGTNGPLLTVGGVQVPLTAVRSLSRPGAAPATPTTPSPTPAPTTAPTTAPVQTTV